MGIKITGVGHYVPDFIVTNDDLAKIVDTSDDWITQRTGIKRRRIATGELAYQMGAKAAKEALKDAGQSIDDIDMILVSTITPDCFTPSIACLIGNELGTKTAVAMDLNAACSGYIYAMDIARNFIETGAYRNILIVSTEIISRVIDYSDRTTCVLFGDGAGATVVTRSNGIYSSSLGGNPSGAYKLFAKMKHHKNPWSLAQENYEMDKVNDFSYGHISMEGEEIFKFAALTLPKVVQSVLKQANLTLDELDLLVPHQANIRILQAANRRLKLPEEKLYVGIEDYGNISSACIPLGLWHLKKEGKLKNHDKICIAGFGAGLTYGAIVFEW